MNVLRQRSGQALIIAVLIFLVLLTAIPSVVFLNRTLSHHGVITQKRLQGRSIAEEGISYAMQQLTQTNSWPYLPAGVLPTFPNAIASTNSEGGFFTLALTKYSDDPTHLQTYEVGIVSTPLDRLKNPIPASGLYAKVSRKTLAAKLTSNYGAAVALQLMKQPVNLGGMTVHWGPIAIFDTGLWTIDQAMNTNRFPRKFTAGTLTGVPGTPTYFRSVGDPSATPPLPPIDSDRKEYWSNADLGFLNPIDTVAYIAAAEATTVGVVPAGATRSCTLPGAVSSCGHFIAPGGPGSPASFINWTFTATVPNSVIYIEGSATFSNMAVDLGNTGALIVTENATFQPGSGPGLAGLSLRVPTTKEKEYPYVTTTLTTPPRWPCDGHILSDACLASFTQLGNGDTNGLGTGGGDGHVHFRGFLYVQKNMTIPAATANWLFDGAIRVDGDFDCPGPTTHASLLFDDVINRNIQANPFDLLIDEVVPAVTVAAP